MVALTTGYRDAVIIAHLFNDLFAIDAVRDHDRGKDIAGGIGKALEA